MSRTPTVRIPVNIDGLSEGTTAEIRMEKQGDDTRIGVILRRDGCSAIRWAAFAVRFISFDELRDALEQSHQAQVVLRELPDGHHVVIVYKLVQYRIHLPIQVPAQLFAA